MATDAKDCDEVVLPEVTGLADLFGCNPMPYHMPKLNTAESTTATKIPISTGFFVELTAVVEEELPGGIPFEVSVIFDARSGSNQWYQNCAAGPSFEIRSKDDAAQPQDLL